MKVKLEKKSSNTISGNQTFNRKHTDWVKARRYIEAYLYKEKNLNGIPRSYVI